MRLALFIAPLALCLSGCAGLSALTQLPPAPAAAANRTVLDEQAAISVELAYQAAARAVSLAVDLGLIRGEAAARVAELDRRAYRAVLTARAAYDAGNATSYGAAVATARAEIAAMIDAAK